MAQKSGAFCPFRFLKLPAFFLVFTLVLFSAHGQERAESSPLDDLVFKVAVFGPSDEIFIWWGHAALIVENTRWNYSRVFDWGIFTYPSDSFLKDFIGENVRYKCTVGRLDADMEMYLAEDRDIEIYTLDLDRTGKEIILTYAENNVLPENCFYDYHEFRDNCSTRIRDIIDMGTRGQLKAAFETAPGRFTIRRQIRRFTWFRPFSEWFLSFMMGQNLDEKVTPWEEMFLPVEIARNITGFRYTDDSGAERSLVSRVELVNRSKKRPPILNEPLTTWPFAWAAGLLAALLFFSAKRFERKYPRPGRVLFGLMQACFGLVLGAMGSVLVFGFSMSNDYFQQNLNVLFINPLLLVTVPLGLLYAFGKSRAFAEKMPLRINPERALRITWTIVFAACAFTALLRVFPFYYQQNQDVLGIVLPAAFVLSVLPDNTYRLKALVRKLRKKRSGGV